MNTRMLRSSLLCFAGPVLVTGLFAQAPKIEFPAAGPAKDEYTRLNEALIASLR